MSDVGATETNDLPKVTLSADKRSSKTTIEEAPPFQKTVVIGIPQVGLEQLAAGSLLHPGREPLALDGSGRLVHAEERPIPAEPLQKFDYIAESAVDAPTQEVMTHAVNFVKDPEFQVGERVVSIDGKEFHIRRVNNDGQRVYIVDAADGGCSFVVRSSSQEGREAEEVMRNYPLARRYLPETYAISDEYDFTVMEKVIGIESEELIQKMKDDSEFVERYAKAFAEMLREIHKHGLQISDVSFAGHNVMVDPRTGDVRFVEQRNLRPSEEIDPGLTPEELLSEFIFENLDSLHDQNEERANPETQRSQEMFMFFFLQACAEGASLEEIFVRFRIYAPTHRFYETYRGNTNRENNGDQENVRSPYDPYAFSRALSPALIAALRRGDFGSFSSLIRSGQFFAEISDENDSRFAPRIIT